jgi:predicted phosphodiesterase
MKTHNNRVYRKILVLPDMHAPWVNWGALEQAHRWYLSHKPELVVCLGDITDQKIWSHWSKDTDDMSPSDELKAAKKCLERLHDMFPRMVILRGNHDSRVLRRAIEAGIPSEMFRDVDQLFNFKGWEWKANTAKFVVDTPRGPILFVHGDEQGGTVAQKSRILGLSVIQGHTHKVSITYTTTLKGTIFGAEMGCIMDTQSKASKYAAPNPVGTTVGFGVVKYGVPYFIDYRPGMKV